MLKRLLVVGTALSLIFLPSLTLAKALPKIDVARIDNDIKVISSDEYEGRGISTPAEAKSIAYIAEGMKAAGFAPGGENGTYFQKVKLRKFMVEAPNLTLSLPKGEIKVNQGVEMTIATRGATRDVGFDNTPIVFVGYGVTAPERGWDDFKDIDVKGKIIVVLINDPDFVEPELKTFNGKAMTYYGRWTYKYEEGARRGAKGVIIIHDSDAASYGWATVKNSNTRERFDIVRDNPLSVSPELEAWMAHDTADQIFSAAGLDLNTLRKQARSKDFHPVELKGVTLNGGYGINTEVIESNNVVGILHGAKRPDEYVLYSAHWDHLGRGAADANGDDIFNGALDNGTGIGALLELGRLFGEGSPPDRSVVLLAFTAEESGLLGSEYYASNPVFPLEKTVAGINMDGMNINGRTKNVEVVGFGQSDLEDTFSILVKKQHRYITPDQSPEAGHFFRSDHFPLSKRGVPMLYAASGLDMVKGGEAAGRAFSDAYTAQKYHQPDDEWSPDWNYDGFVEDLMLNYQIGNQLANSTKWPQWKIGSEFKPARDKSSQSRNH